MMDLVEEEPELQPKENQVKRKRTENEEKDLETEKTEARVEAPFSVPRRESEENPLKRKRMDIPRDGHEPHPKERGEKRRRKETEKRANFSSQYMLGKLLGKGSFGAVYEGARISDGKKVALKFMVKKDDAAYITLPGDTDRLPLEVALMKLVCKPPHCPCVIQLLDWFETQELFILVLELPKHCVELFEHCQDVQISEAKAQIIMQQVINAACHCHERGVFHRDIKEENILVNPQTLEVKLIDFGCGDLLQDTPYTEYAGTKIFEPPEWIVDQKYEAEPATVWGLGILLYGLLCKEEPFEDANAVVDGHLNFPDHLSQASCSLINWCLQRDPKQRPTLEQMLTHYWFKGQINMEQQNRPK